MISRQETWETRKLCYLLAQQITEADLYRRVNPSKIIKPRKQPSNLKEGCEMTC